MQADQCMRCAHYLGRLKCLAFPDRIPDEIITGEVSHAEPYNGDHGVIFQEAGGQ